MMMNYLLNIFSMGQTSQSLFVNISTPLCYLVVHLEKENVPVKKINPNLVKDPYFGMYTTGAQ